MKEHDSSVVAGQYLNFEDCVSLVKPSSKLAEVVPRNNKKSVPLKIIFKAFDFSANLILEIFVYFDLPNDDKLSGAKVGDKPFNELEALRLQ